jgi:hypothetical protein
VGDILRWRRKAGNIMAKYRVTAYINFEDVLELDEKDFENEEEMKEAIYEYVLESLYCSWTKLEE